MPPRSIAPTGRSILRDCVRAARVPLGASIASATLRQVAFLAMPYLLGRAVAEGLAAGDGAALIRWLTWFALAVIVEGVGLLGWQWWANLAEARLAAQLRGRLLDVALQLDDAGPPTGDLVARATDDIERVLVWVHGLTTWIVIAVTVTVLVPAIGGMDPSLLVVALACAALLAILNAALPRRYGPRLATLARTQGARSQAVEELVSAALPLRGVGGEGVLIDRHDRVSAEVTTRVRAAARLRAAWDAVGDGIPAVGIGVGLGFGAAAALAGRLDVGQLTTFALWMGTVQVATGAVVARLGDRAEAVAGADRVAEVLCLAPDPTGRIAADPGPLAELRLDEVHPVHGRAAPISLRVAAGEWIAVTGRTGLGKSALLRALAGRTEHAGTVCLGGLHLAQQSPDERAARVRLVGQGSRLLYGTVRENLVLGAGPLAVGTPDDDELLRHCHTAAFDEVLHGLPDGLDTMVGEHGSTLSGGERQRLALARALVRDTPVLLLDDISSGLDSGTEQRVLERLRAVTSERIVVWASHRSAVHARADRVVELGELSDPPRDAP